MSRSTRDCLDCGVGAGSQCRCDADAHAAEAYEERLAEPTPRDLEDALSNVRDGTYDLEQAKRWAQAAWRVASEYARLEAEARSYSNAFDAELSRAQAEASWVSL